MLHARMGLASEDESLADSLIDDLLNADIADVGNIRDALDRSPALDKTRLWRAFRGKAQVDRPLKESERFRAGLALVTLDNNRHEREPGDDQFLVEQLVTSNPFLQPALLQLLDSMSLELLEPLESVFVDLARSESEQIAAAYAIARFAPEDGSRLARLLCVATPGQFEILFEEYQRAASDMAREQLLSVMTRQPCVSCARAEEVGPFPHELFQEF